MRNFARRMLIVGVALAAVASTGIGSAASLACGIGDSSSKPHSRRVIASQSGNCVVEPLLSRSDAALVYVNDNEPDNLGEANLRGLDFQTSGSDDITVVVNTSERIPRNINEFPQTTGAGVRAPYGGVHVLALFQTPQLQTTQVMGPTLSGGTATFGPYNIADNYHFFFYYGNTLSSGANPSCGWGIYDQFGQLFSVFSQEFDNPKNYSCTNHGNGQITFKFKYRTNWRLQPDGLARSVEIVRAGQTISNIKAFTWMDHEVGGPPPVGLVVGLTHYTDVIPKNGYDFGAWVGDPNSGGIPSHTCPRYPIIGTVPNPLASGGPCYISTGSTVGLGMRPTSLNVSA